MGHGLDPLISLTFPLLPATPYLTLPTTTTYYRVDGDHACLACLPPSTTCRRFGCLPGTLPPHLPADTTCHTPARSAAWNLPYLPAIPATCHIPATPALPCLPLPAHLPYHLSYLPELHTPATCLPSCYLPLPACQIACHLQTDTTCLPACPLACWEHPLPGMPFCPPLPYHHTPHAFATPPCPHSPCHLPPA